MVWYNPPKKLEAQMKRVKNVQWGEEGGEGATTNQIYFALAATRAAAISGASVFKGYRKEESTSVEPDRANEKTERKLTCALSKNGC